MDGTVTRQDADRPDDLEQRARAMLEAIIKFCRSREGPFAGFELRLWVRLYRLGCLLVQLFLAARRERSDLAPHLAGGAYRPGDPAAKRQLRTRFGPVTYARPYLIRVGGGGPGFHPLDAELGLTRDGFSPWVIQFTCRLATRLSFAATRVVCRAALGRSPSTEEIEHWVLGLGRQAQPFAQQQKGPAGDGEVLVIEIDGKCPPTATAAELRKRRGKRRPGPGCGGDGKCKCQRHRGRERRKRRGSKKRRRKGDKSKNGKEVTVVVVYTLKRGADGRLHGPLNKKVWASFGGRRAGADWARQEASKRGFKPGTEKTVQVLLDGANGLRENMRSLFPDAILTLDVYHAVEKLWTLGRRFHAEGSDALKAQVEEWKALLYDGRAAELVGRLRTKLEREPVNGPGTKGRREALASAIHYLGRRLELMRYREWRERDLVLGSGQVEGAVRHVVGERLDCAGMRWIPGRAEALLHLRCIELNGDWNAFIAWGAEQHQKVLDAGGKVRIRSNEPLKCAKARVRTKKPGKSSQGQAA